MKYITKNKGLTGILGAPGIKGGLIGGGALGAGTGAIIDKDNPWRGAVLGLGAGSLIGGGIGTGILAAKAKGSGNLYRQYRASVDKYHEGLTGMLASTQKVPPPDHNLFSKALRKVRGIDWINYVDKVSMNA